MTDRKPRRTYARADGTLVDRDGAIEFARRYVDRGLGMMLISRTIVQAMLDEIDALRQETTT